MCISEKIWDLLGGCRSGIKHSVNNTKHLQIMCMGFGLLSVDKNANTRSSHLPSKSGLYI
jgi:hypothetical protein